MDISKDIFKGCRKGERKAQEALYHAVHAPLIRLTLRYVINKDDALEIINKALFKVFTKINDFKGNHKNFGGWIKRITVNETLDFIRAKKSFDNKHTTVDFINELPGAYQADEIESNPEHILTLLENLPAKSRAVFNLFVIEGYNHAEIAELLNMSEANSRWNLHEARRLLQGWIKQKELI